ncbi:TPA: hypothetical protein ACH3X1_006647 [Trebouxia sp. C0004]
MSQHPGSAPVPETQGTQRPVRGVLGERRLIQGTLTPRNTPYFRQNGASCSRARSAVDPGGSAQEHQDENIQQPSDPTQQTWYQDPELPERKKMKLQQGQCLIRLLDKQNSLLQQLIATTTSRTSSPAHNQFREKITAATQKVMWQKGFYTGDTEYDMIAMSVLSKPNLAAAMADYQLYVDLVKKAETAARNYRTEVSKKISEMSEELWSGEDGTAPHSSR